MTLRGAISVSFFLLSRHRPSSNIKKQLALSISTSNSSSSSTTAGKFALFHPFRIASPRQPFQIAFMSSTPENTTAAEAEKEDASSKRSRSSSPVQGEKKKNCRRQNNFDDNNVDQRKRVPHEGSYANPAMQEQFGIVVGKAPDITDEKMVKRKVALFLGFLGTNYGGFQINMNQRTLQAEIELALFKAGMVTELNFGHPQKITWSSSARTDKGVHGCAQVCSLKVEMREEELNDMEKNRKRLEEHLPEDIRILDIERVTRNFCAKTQRDRVRYQYMLPSFLLHPDCRSLFKEQGIPLEGRQEVAKEPLTQEEVEKLKVALKDFRSTPAQRDLLQSALKAYEGTHKFHNYSKGVKANEGKASRYILSFTVQDPIVVNGVEWIPTQVLGQSFLLHQIRKMISMAVDVARGVAPLDILVKALSKTENIRIAVAPAQGLFLEMSYFVNYNRHKQQNQELADLDWTVEGPARDRWEAFRKNIRQHIVDEEDQQGNFIQYMYVQECIFEYRRFYRLDPPVGEEKEEDSAAESEDDSKGED
jgi:tRNA pseudouridine38-40 synthase